MRTWLAEYISLNKTSVELKVVVSEPTVPIAESLNKTSVELKVANQKVPLMAKFLCLNKTSVELKEMW